MHQPMYDDETLQWMEQENRKDLVNRLWQYALALEEYAIRLRKQVNTFSMGLGLKEPYPDPASDFTIRFNDHPAYAEFAVFLSDKDLDWKISD